MATSPYQTFANIYTAVLADAKETTSSNMVTLVKRWINEGYEQVILRKKRDWLDSQLVVQLNEKVEAEATVTNASTTVTFESGTTFPSGVELQFKSDSFEEIYNVDSTSSATLTLSNAFLGTSSTSANGVVWQPHIILDSSVRHVYKVYHQHFQQPLLEVGPQQMRSIQEANGPQFGYAEYYTLFGQDSSGDRRLVLFPYPAEDYTLYLDVNTFITPLSAADDEPIIPMQYRQILYWYAAYKLWMYHRNEMMAGAAMGNFNAMLGKIDGEVRSEIEFPQLQVRYPKSPSLLKFAKPFDPSTRDNS